MINNNICPVCGKEKKAVSLSDYDCEYCGFSYAFVQFFASREGYEAWENNVKEAIIKFDLQKRTSFAASNSLSLGNNGISFRDPDNNMYIAQGNGQLQTEKHAIQFVSSERNFAILYKDGTVRVFGEDNSFGQKDTQAWRDIKYIAAGPNCTYGIDKDGKLCFSGAIMEASVKHWKDLKLIKCSDELILGICTNGKILLASKTIAANEFETVKHWSRLKDIALAKNSIVGLLENGSVKYWGKVQNSRNQCENWQDIIAIATDNTYVYGLTKDGNVLVAGSCLAFLDKNRKNAESWTDIIAISCNKSGISAVSRTGKLLFAGTIAGDEKKVREKWSTDIKDTIVF